MPNLFSPAVQHSNQSMFSHDKHMIHSARRQYSFLFYHYAHSAVVSSSSHLHYPQTGGENAKLLMPLPLRTTLEGTKQNNFVY